MKRLKIITAKVVLACSLAFSFVTAPPALLTASVAVVATQSACESKSIRQFKQGLDKAAVTLNAAAKTNRSFYESGVYGTAGSQGAIEARQKVAKAIHDANEWLIKAIDKAKTLKGDSVSFEGDKLEILLSLSKAAANLKTGRTDIDIVLQSVALIINQSVAIIQALKSADAKYLIPQIQDWKLPQVEV